MTEVKNQEARAWDSDSRGVSWHLELDRSTLLPGRLVGGRITLRADRAIEARGVVIALVAEEHWRYTVVESNAKGGTRTEIKTAYQELVRQPVAIHGALRLAAGETWVDEFEVPVPPMGPASLNATEAGLDWTIEGKLDIDDALDSGIAADVVVAQPIALLRAGAVHVGEFALYESADVGGDDITGSIRLEPMPLVTGEPFMGRIELRLPGSIRVQEIRAELRSVVEATVSSGRSEQIVAWSGVVAPGGTFDGAVSIDVSGTVGTQPLPTIELPHGKAQATFHVILARAWARDVHLVRDVTIATTREI